MVATSGGNRGFTSSRVSTWQRGLIAGNFCQLTLSTRDGQLATHWPNAVPTTELPTTSKYLPREKIQVVVLEKSYVRVKNAALLDAT